MGTIIQPQVQEPSEQNSALGTSQVMIPEAIQQMVERLGPLVGQELRLDREASERMGPRYVWISDS